MKARFHMHKNGLMVEHNTREAMIAIRRNDPRFKGARIAHIIQMRPDIIELGTVYALNGDDKPLGNAKAR
jgi:hypothetical protein